MAVLLISDDEWTGQRLRQALTQQGYECPPNHSVASELAGSFLAQAHPELVLVVLGPDIDRMVSRLVDLRARTQVPLLAVGPADDAHLVLRALRNGASEYLDQDDLEAELEGALHRCRNSDGPRRSAVVVAVAGPCGGTGASSLVVNIGAVLARENGRALLVDLRLNTGDLAPFLNLKPTNSLANLGQHVGRLDRVLFQRCLSPHPCGLQLLAAPLSPGDLEYVTPDLVHQALSMGRNLFASVVVDIDMGLRAIHEPALRLADRIVVPMRLDFPCLRNTRRLLDRIAELGIARDKLRIVVTHQGLPQQVPAGKAEEALGLSISHYVPDDPKVMNQAANNGEPAVLGAPSARVSRSLVEIAKALRIS
jgi:pilus assembly protein CpaE